MTREGLQLIMSFEGFRSRAYWDRHGGVWTIGYGTTVYPNGQPVRKGDRVTRRQARDMMVRTLERTVVPAVMSMVTAELNQWQLDALTSFAYNCGIGNLRKSTLLKMVNQNPNNPRIRREFLKWDMAGGERLAGLKNRRVAESLLYFSGPRPSRDSQTVGRLSREFTGKHATPSNVKRTFGEIKRDEAARKEVQRQWLERSKGYMNQMAAEKAAAREVRPNLSRQFRANSQEYLRRYAETQRAARDAGSGAVNENLVRKAVAEVVSERLRGILG